MENVHLKILSKMGNFSSIWDTPTLKLSRHTKCVRLTPAWEQHSPNDPNIIVVSAHSQPLLHIRNNGSIRFMSNLFVSSRTRKAINQVLPEGYKVVIRGGKFFLAHSGVLTPLIGEMILANDKVVNC